jgi:hypothetical protein
LEASQKYNDDEYLENINKDDLIKDNKPYDDPN